MLSLDAQVLLHQARGAWKIFRRSLTLVVAVRRCEVLTFHLAHEYLLQVWLSCSSRRGRVASKRGHNGGCENPQSRKDASDARMTSRYRTAKGSSRNCRACAVPVGLGLGSASHLVDAPVPWGRK